MKKVYIETYGCQMNVADTEVVLSVLNQAGYEPTTALEGADLAFMNTCAIRENAEEKIWNRLDHWKNLKKRNPKVVVGVLGCMAEHLRKDLLKDSGSIVDLIVGPDEYRKLPALVDSINGDLASEVKQSVQARDEPNGSLRHLSEVYGNDQTGHSDCRKIIPHRDV